MGLRSVIAVAAAAMLLGALGVLVAQRALAPTPPAPRAAAQASPPAQPPAAAAATGASADPLPWEQDDAAADTDAPLPPDPGAVDGADGLGLAREALARLEASEDLDPRIDVQALRRNLDLAEEMQRLARELRPLTLAPASPERTRAIRERLARMRALQRELQEATRAAAALRAAAAEPAA
ncbi:hypothetical protein [Coralloluteibacterium stylophorae]|uniref:Uncharacterized protein n=1 Tax=Coralloluteibacterium stylophorae TaxID=1776034 RepID=A0A8J8AZS1_9GAMM|nr:hypothetical protein [Coralloluteibacterium stylophorae]MBS7456794.1 hypothetical protein [Coralloluteibacterium stylophorae]